MMARNLVIPAQAGTQGHRVSRWGATGSETTLNIAILGSGFRRNDGVCVSGGVLS
jgi:hypothetical protein